MTEKRAIFQSVRSSPLYSSFNCTLSTPTLSVATKKKAKTNWKTQPSRLRPYLIGEQIGGNEMSKIFSAIHCVNYCPAAIKMIPLRKLKRSFAYGQQIMNAETILAPLLFHPHITPIYETIHSETHLMQIMQLLENGNLYCLLAQIAEIRYEKQMQKQASLEQILSQQNIKNEDSHSNSTSNISNDEDIEKNQKETLVDEEPTDFELSYDQKLDFVDQILSAVEYLHSHFICHRDIKLDNILLDKNMTNVKLCDFGFSAISLPSKPVSGLFGSFGYAAPEVIENKHPYDGIAADMWSIGVLIFVIFAERFPFDIEPDNEQTDQDIESEDTESETNYNLNEFENDKQNSSIMPQSSSCSCSSFSSRNGSVLHQTQSSECINILSYFEDIIKQIDYSGIPDSIISIIQSLFVIDPKKRATCHQIRQNPVFNSLQHRIINKINNSQDKNIYDNNADKQFHIDLNPILEKEALKVVVMRIAELKKKTITKVMSNLKSPEENDEKVLYNLIKSIIDFEGYFSSPNSIYNEYYELPLSSTDIENISRKNQQDQKSDSSSSDKEIEVEEKGYVHVEFPVKKYYPESENSKGKRQARNKRGNSISTKHSKSNSFTIARSNSFSTLQNTTDENCTEETNSSLLASSFRTINELKTSETVTVFGDPAKIMNSIDNYLIKNHYSVSYNVVGERKAVALSEEDEVIIITIEIGKNHCNLDPMLYYDVKLVSKSGKKEDFEDVCFFIKSRFALPIFGNN